MIQFRRGSSDQWALANPILAEGEAGYITDTKETRIGDGVTPFNSLPPLPSDAAATEALETIESGRLSEPQLSATTDAAIVAATATDLRPEDGMFSWHSKLLNAANERADYLMVGDSLWEDYGTTTDAARRGMILRNTLRTLYPSGAVGGLGFVPARYNYSTATFVRPVWTYAGGSTIDQASSLGLRAKQLYPARTATITTNLTSFWLLFDKMSNDTWEIRVDGALVATYTPPSEGAVPADRCTVWKSGAYASGSHTVEVKSTVGGGNFGGGYFYDGDETKGVHYWDGSYSGALASTFYAVTPTSSPVASSRWADFIKSDRVNPSLVCVGTLVNDCSAVSAATYKTNMQNLINLIQTKTTAHILLMPHWRPTDRTLISPWEDYLTALRELVASETNVSFFDLTARVPTQTGDPNSMLYDLVHLNAKGQKVKAGLEQLALIPR
jgi:lysophospholipase L1-like esterase